MRREDAESREQQSQLSDGHKVCYFMMRGCRVVSKHRYKCLAMVPLGAEVGVDGLATVFMVVGDFPRRGLEDSGGYRYQAVGSRRWELRPAVELRSERPSPNLPRLSGMVKGTRRKE